MAPTRRPNIRVRAAAASSTPATLKQSTSNLASKDPAQRLNKKEKRTAKHNTLMSRVRDSSVTKTKKRRRPAKKLSAAEGLDGLRDALPDFDEEEDEWEGCSDSDTGDGEKKSTRRRREGKMTMRSLKSKPGAMKRKHAMHQREVDRFGRNLAAMTGSGGMKGSDDVQPGGPGQRARWNALRAFIGSTMERDRAFEAG